MPTTYANFINGRSTDASDWSMNINPSNTADVVWGSCAAGETFTWCSLWSGTTGGTFLGSDDLVPATTVSQGDAFKILTGDLDLSIT